MLVDSESSGDILLSLKGVELDKFDHRKMKEMELGLKTDELHNVSTLGIDLWGEFPWIFDKESILFLLRQFKDGSIILDKPYPITMEFIESITGLWSVGDLLGKKIVKYREVEELIGIDKDPWSLLINTIVDPIVRYVPYGITYTIYFRNHEGSTLAIVVYLSHKMVKENK